MKRTLFVFGRTPDLAFLELTSFFPTASRLSPALALVDEELSVTNLMQSLGGTVKIAKVLGSVASPSAEALIEVLADRAVGGKLVFGLSFLSGARASIKLLHDTKAGLEKLGINARYVEGKDASGLSSVVVTKQRVVELLIVSEQKSCLLAETVAVQDFEEWNARDFLRPAPDPKHGMLPPKVARMIVNLALSATAVDHPMLYDPFCGVGTIVQEALLRGANCTGSDISSEAIERAKKNLEWLRKRYPKVASLYVNLFVADATHIATSMAVNSVDAIATEPFLGDTGMGGKGASLSDGGIKNTIKGLEKLYIGCLREWTAVLKPKAKVVIAFPAYVTRHGVMTVKTVVDRCESLGYTLLTGPIEYSRPQAVVRREFYLFQKK